MGEKDCQPDAVAPVDFSQVPEDEFAWARLTKVLIQRLTSHFWSARQSITAHDIDDGIQEALCTVLSQLDRFDRKKGTFDNWLFIIAKRKILDILKKKLLRGESDGILDRLPFRVISRDDDCDMPACPAKQKFFEILASLSTSDREFALAYVEGDMIDKTKSQNRVRFSRLRERIAASMRLSGHGVRMHIPQGVPEKDIASA